MNKRISVLSIFALLLVGSGLSSCAKKETLDTPFARLIGKWRQVQQATDDNNNGTLDNWEITPVAPTFTNTIEFDKDSTGIDKKTNSLDLKFHWHVVGESSVELDYDANDTTIYRIFNVSSSSLTLTTRLPQGLVGLYYDKD